MNRPLTITTFVKFNEFVFFDKNQTSRRSPVPVKRRMAMRSKGYELRMSKSSDSITAAKMLAEAR